MIPLVAAGAVDRIAGAVAPALASLFGQGGDAPSATGASPAQPSPQPPALHRLAHDLHRALLDLQESGANGAAAQPPADGASG